MDSLERAKLGDSRAIADWLNQLLSDEPVSVSVDREGTRLSVGVYQTASVERDRLIAQITQGIYDLNNSALEKVNLLGHRVGNPIPIWSFSFDPREQLISLESAEGNPRESSTSTQAFNQPLPSGDRFLVCGLGSLGQYCVYNLKRFDQEGSEVYITAIDRQQPEDWEIRDLPTLLAEDVVIGDCRDEDILERAGIHHCRAVLLVTSDESVNIETAIAARRLNPTVRLVVRSSRQSLNELLRAQLGNLVALDPNELPAPAFALEGLRAGILGFVDIANRRLQIVEQRVRAGDYRFDNSPATNLHRKQYRLLSLVKDENAGQSATSLIRNFYQWQPDSVVQAGDRVAYVELVDIGAGNEQQGRSKQGNVFQQIWNAGRDLLRKSLGQRIVDLREWIQANPTRQLASKGLLFALILWLAGVILLRVRLDLPLQQAVFTSIILLLGGYGDVFGGLVPEKDVPPDVHVVSLLITIASLIVVLSAVGVVADNLLSSRFEFWQKRLPVPKANHVVLVGLGRVGRRVAALMQEFKQPFVAITQQIDHARLTSQMPLLVGNFMTELGKANLETAKSIIVVTEDQMLNLELALMARAAAAKVNRTIELVIRIYDQRFSDNLNRLLPDIRVLGVYELSAQAFTGAAFGENILTLFRLRQQTILVTEYIVSKGDTLDNKILSQVAYGYAVVPIYHQRNSQKLEQDQSDCFLPSDDRRLHAGDRLIVLSSINGLRRIERDEITPPKRYRLDAQTPRYEGFKLDIGNDLSRISGCSLEKARSFVESLPGAIELELYDYQACRLEQELGRQVALTLTPIEE